MYYEYQYINFIQTLFRKLFKFKIIKNETIKVNQNKQIS